MNVALVFSLLVGIVAILFAFQNPETMNVKFLGFRSVDGPKALFLLITFGLGLLTGWLGAIPARLRAAAEARSLRKERDQLLARPAATATPESMANASMADPYTARFGTPPNA